MNKIKEGFLAAILTGAAACGGDQKLTPATGAHQFYTIYGPPGHPEMMYDQVYVQVIEQHPGSPHQAVVDEALRILKNAAEDAESKNDPAHQEHLNWIKEAIKLAEKDKTRSTKDTGWLQR